MKRLVFFIATGIALLGCASIIEGTSQEIVVSTDPAGANCALNREDVTIARVNPTPGAATIKKTKYDITIVCDMDGFQQATYMNHSGTAGATFGNILLGGAVGWAIDSASGADNKYETPVNLTMVPNQPGQQLSPQASQQPNPQATSGTTPTATSGSDTPAKP